ncbi:MAG: SdpI family protein [Gordonia sp. (in: high G+C Gram-positive bacteria)]|uniref:SdpI family protein n=2 Tax=Gordonia sp. (in: high G+C Gram-positive bacteria) TaxID=84139 RepID=UPI003C7299B1
MSIVSAVVAVLTLVLAAVWLGVGVAGLAGALRRNRWVGVRSAETLRSEETFAVANKVAAPGFLGAAAILAVTGGIALAIGSWGVLVAVFGVVVAVGVVSVVGGMALQAAKAVPEPAGCGTDGGCCSPAPAGDAAGHDEAAAAADCGESSCGSCALSGMCLSSDDEPGHAPAQHAS